MPESKSDKAPKRLKTANSRSQVIVNGIELKWDVRSGTFTFQGLPVAMMWVDSTLAGLMSGLATMVGPERFSLALQSEGRKSVESDWQLMSRYPTFREAFAAIGVVAGVAGWGEWHLLEENEKKQECRFRAYNTWEGLYQKTLQACWGSAMLAGKLAGYCSKRFDVNCWATQTSFIARGDPYDEFIVSPSSRVLEAEIGQLLSADKATRADMAVALGRLREAQSQLLTNQESLEIQVRQRTEELAASLAQFQVVNERLRQEVTERTQAEEARRQSEVRLQKIMEHAPISLAIVGADERIEYINQKAIETFGYLPEDIPVMSQWWQKAYPDVEYRREVIERWTGYMTAAMEHGHDIQRDAYRITCKDGVVKTIAVFGVIVDEKVIVMFDDITTGALREELLLQSNAELEGRVQERTAELARRNSLLQAEIAERRQIEARLTQTNLTLQRTTAHLRRLAARLAKIEDVERKRMAHLLHDHLQQALVAADFSIAMVETARNKQERILAAEAAREAVAEAIRESRSLALELSPPIMREASLALVMRWIQQRMLEKHGLRVEVEVDEQLPPVGEDLRTAIFHSVRELLLNVIKHSGASAARILITALSDGKMRVVVSDTGRGYIPSASAHLEEQFSGFGQAAIRERFESLGGHMVVESAPGRGCRVTLTAPILAHDTPEYPGGSPTAAKDRFGHGDGDGLRPISDARIRVLLADDHTMLRQGLAEHLARDPGIKVVGQAANGLAAVEYARALQPDMILMDVSMPEMNGIDATRLIRSEFPGMVVIGLSMHADTNQAEKMLQAGASAYLVKSEAPEALIATIRSCWKH